MKLSIWRTRFIAFRGICIRVKYREMDLSQRQVSEGLMADASALASASEGDITDEGKRAVVTMLRTGADLVAKHIGRLDAADFDGEKIPSADAFDPLEMGYISEGGEPIDETDFNKLEHPQRVRALLGFRQLITVLLGLLTGQDDAELLGK